MKVTLRQRNQGKMTSLYLDYYENGARTKKTLKLYLHPTPKTKQEKDHNKKTLALANEIVTKESIKIKAEQWGIRDLERSEQDVLEFLELLRDERKGSPNTYGNWNSMIKCFKKYQKKPLPFNQLDRARVQGFKDHVDLQAIKQNTKYSYFAKFKAALKIAVEREIIIKNPGQFVKHFSQEETQKEYLTLEELKKVSREKCESDMLKRAFLFGCLTGLRFSDIISLTKNDLHEHQGYYKVPFRQQKTEGLQYHCISKQAVDLLPEPIAESAPFFMGLGPKLDSGQNDLLRSWIKKASINKHITFHCSRHTYATLQLTAGTDIYVLSNLLGHKHVKTTEVYTKVVDQKKIEAANKIKI